MLDIIIKSATIYDGSGNQPFAADVTIKDGRIDFVGELEGREEAKQTIDGSNLILSPGFIDTHSHSDTNLLVNPNAESKIHQGITTEVIGSCGSSAFPLRGKRLELAKSNLSQYDLEVDWSDISGYMKRLEQSGPAVNVVIFVGLGSIRASTMGYGDEKPSAEELEAMKRDVWISLENGARGLSTGLIYPPDFFADTEEIIELAREGKGYGAIYSSHIRGEGDTLLEAIEEALKIGFESGIGVQVSHLKASGKQNWGKVKRAIEMIEEAREKGLDVQFDKYPYIASATGLDSLLPKWAHVGGVDETLSRLSDAEMSKRIRAEVRPELETARGWESILITFAGSAEFEEYEGESVAEIAGKLNMEPYDAFVLLLARSRLNAAIASFSMSQEDTDMAILHPLGLLCTDSSAWAPYGKLGIGKPHPRAYGSFPKYFNDYVKSQNALSLEEAIAKVTRRSAERFGLRERGLIREGYFADILLMDWKRLQDRATFKEPHQYADGIEYVIVNGTVTVDKGKTTNERGGKILKRE
jgi:N-acyl-D-amino-acid deacylase